MFYIRPRKYKTNKGFFICYKEPWGHVMSHHVDNMEDVDYFLNLLEDNGMTPEQMNEVRVYPALSWKIRNTLFDDYGYSKPWFSIPMIFFLSTIIVLIVKFFATN